MIPPFHQTVHRAAALLCMATACTCLFPQPADTLRRVLGEARVSAGRLPAGLAAATPLQSLDSADLRRSGAADIGAALRRLAGVNLRDYGGAGGLKTVSVRGLGAAHTAVSYDGLPVSDARGGQVDLGQFPLEQLGGLSLSVTDAPELLCPVKAVAAATVRLASPLPAAGRGLHGTAALRFGAFGTAMPSLRLQGPAGPRTSLSAAAAFRYGRNDYPFTLRNGQLVSRERRKGSRMQAWTGELDMRHATPGGGELAAKAYLYDSHRRLPGQVTLYTDEGDERLRERTAFAQALWHRRFGPFRLMAGGKFNWQESRYADVDAQYPGGALRQHYWQREWYATAGASWQRGPWGAAYALDLLYDGLNSNLPDEGHARRLGVLQCLSLRFARRRLTATARLTGHVYRNRRSGGEAARDARRLAPVASVSWLALERRGRGGRAVRLYLRASAEEHFRVPTFTESYYYHLGAQDLRPESARRAGAGLALLLEGGGQCWRPVLSVTADGYGGTVRDRITSIPYNLFVWRTQNFGKVRTGGLDVTLRAQAEPARGHLLVLQGNYSLQRAADLSDRASRSYGLQPAYMPRHTGAASLAYEGPWLCAAVSVTGASERWSTHEHTAGTRLPGYAEAGLALYRSFRLGRCRLSVRADLSNAFDTQYEVVSRYPMPGRSWRLSLQAEW